MMRDTIQHYISKFNMTRFLNDDLLHHLHCFHFPVYSSVYTEQQEQHYLYFLVEGQVQCSHYHLNGKLAVIALSQPFCTIGDLEILNREPVKSNVIATRETTMLGIEADIIHRYGADDPRFLRFLIEQLSEKLYKNDQLHSNNVLPVLNRLVVYMLSQAKSDNTVLMPDKEELASLLGATSRHLNRVLKQLVESNCISAGYPLVRILNRTALEALC